MDLSEFIRAKFVIGKNWGSKKIIVNEVLAALIIAIRLEKNVWALK